MDNEEILQKAKAQKAVIGEMEQKNINKSMGIAIIVAGVIAVAGIICEFALGHLSGGMAIACICYGWASCQYFCQYFLAKRPWQVLIGAVLHGLAFVLCLVLYILLAIKVI